MGKKKEEAAPQPIELPTKSSTAGSGSTHYSSGQPQAFAGFQNFAQTGGFSPDDLSNIRARALSPVRAVYANAQREVNRQRALQGGYSPGFGVLQARMAREKGQEISDQSINTEGEIAKLVQQGKLAGLQGMASTEGTSGGSSGGGGDEAAATPQQALVPEQKKGFWGKLFGGLKKVGQIALPVAAGAFTGGLGTAAAAGLTGLGSKVATGALKKVGISAAGR
jgi:hypothetical protein